MKEMDKHEIDSDYAPVSSEETKEKDESHNEFWEEYARIHASNHLTLDQFSDHTKIEGYFENKQVPDFLGCDRLLKMDNMFGRIQQGYNPMKNRAFLYAHIKTSIYDSAASSYKRQLSEKTMFRSRKDENENVLYSTKRKPDTAVILYKAENKPWSEHSIAPYIRRINQGALRKTMPFLLRDEELERIETIARERRALQDSEAEALAEGEYDQLSSIRLKSREMLYEENMLSSMVIKKVSRSRWFFKRLNYSFDIQKQEMFLYYRDVKKRHRGENDQVVEDIPPINPPEKPNEEGN